MLDQSSDFATTDGDLSVESATSNVVFSSVVDIDARNSYSSTSLFGGLIDFSNEETSLLATALSTQADVQGDINLIVGGDLEFQGGTFAATGAINTDVAGDTRILATVDTDFSYEIDHDNNSLIVVDTTTVDVEQTAGFTQLIAGNGVNLDPDSAVTVGLVATQAALGASAMGLVGVGDMSDPTQDMAITEFFLPDATGSPEPRIASLTQDAVGNALAGLQSGDPADSDDSDSEGDGRFDFDSSMVDVVLPTTADGAGYAYLDALKSGRVRAVAMSVYASGAIPADEAIHWISELPGVESIVFGASSAGNIKGTKALVDKYMGKAA